MLDTSVPIASGRPPDDEEHAISIVSRGSPSEWTLLTPLAPLPKRQVPTTAPIWYRAVVATNLRLRQDAQDAVRREARRTGRSQQDVIRDAIDRHLGLSTTSAERGELDVLIATGAVRRPRSAYRTATRRLALPTGMTSTDLLDRDDRI